MQSKKFSTCATTSYVHFSQNFTLPWTRILVSFRNLTSESPSFPKAKVPRYPITKVPAAPSLPAVRSEAQGRVGVVADVVEAEESFAESIGCGLILLDR